MALDEGDRSTSAARIGEGLDLALRGRLPCLNCRYELQGLSIQGPCPECGLAIRATILHRVDPQADAFRPMPAPRLTAWAVFFWGAFGLLAAMFVWTLRGADLLRQVLGVGAVPNVWWAAPAATLAAAASGLAALTLIYPVSGTPRRWVLRACGGVAAYVPLVAAMWWIHFGVDPGAPAPYFETTPVPQRVLARLAVDASLLGILLGLRPNARQLVARSLVLRTGRVDRQTIYATVAAVGVMTAGDLLRLGASQLSEADKIWLGGPGTLLVIVGSGLLTLALVGGAVDSWRIKRAILTPGPSMNQLLRGDTPES